MDGISEELATEARRRAGNLDGLRRLLVLIRQELEREAYPSWATMTVILDRIERRNHVQELMWKRHGDC